MSILLSVCVFVAINSIGEALLVISLLQAASESAAAPNAAIRIHVLIFISPTLLRPPDDPRRDEYQQFVVRGRDVARLEQISEDRNLVDERQARARVVVLHLIDA